MEYSIPVGIPGLKEWIKEDIPVKSPRNYYDLAGSSTKHLKSHQAQRNLVKTNEITLDVLF